MVNKINYKSIKYFGICCIQLGIYMICSKTSKTDKQDQFDLLSLHSIVLTYFINYAYILHIYFIHHISLAVWCSGYDTCLSPERSGFNSPNEQQQDILLFFPLRPFLSLPFSLPSQRNFPISFKPKVAIAKFSWKMQRKTWYYEKWVGR